MSVDIILRNVSYPFSSTAIRIFNSGFIVGSEQGNTIHSHLRWISACQFCSSEKEIDWKKERPFNLEVGFVKKYEGI